MRRHNASFGPQFHWIGAGPGNPPAGGGVHSAEPSRPSNGGAMERERSPTEARSGVISGRIITVLVVSFLGASAALGLVWFYFLGAG